MGTAPDRPCPECGEPSPGVVPRRILPWWPWFVVFLAAAAVWAVWHARTDNGFVPRDDLTMFSPEWSQVSGLTAGEVRRFDPSRDRGRVWSAIDGVFPSEEAASVEGFGIGTGNFGARTLEREWGWPLPWVRETQTRFYNDVVRGDRVLAVLRSAYRLSREGDRVFTPGAPWVELPYVLLVDDVSGDRCLEVEGLLVAPLSTLGAVVVLRGLLGALPWVRRRVRTPWAGRVLTGAVCAVVLGLSVPWGSVEKVSTIQFDRVTAASASVVLPKPLALIRQQTDGEEVLARDIALACDAAGLGDDAPVTVRIEERWADRGTFVPASFPVVWTTQIGLRTAPPPGWSVRWDSALRFSVSKYDGKNLDWYGFWGGVALLGVGGAWIVAGLGRGVLRRVLARRDRRRVARGECAACGYLGAGPGVGPAVTP